MADQIKILTNQRKFTLVYNDFLESKLLDYYEKLVFIALKRFADNETNEAFPSLKKLSQITGISVPKIRRTIQSLEQKKVLKITHRINKSYGHMSNIYTLYDLPEIWKAESEEQIEEITDAYQEDRMIRYLESKGYEVTKKELASVPTKAHRQADQQTSSYYNIHKNESCQVAEDRIEHYSLDQIKEQLDYSIMIEREPYRKTDIESVIDILYDVMNTAKAAVRIGGEDKPIDVVIAKLRKLTYEHVIYCIQKYEEQTDRIKNQKAYMLTLLYNAPEQMNLDITNQVHMNK